MDTFKRRSAFSLIEIILVIAILAIILIFTLSISSRAIGRGDIQSTRSMIVQAIRRSQVLAQTNIDDTTWGAYICVAPDCTDTEKPTAIIFGRSAYGSLDNDDKQFELPATVTLSGSLYDVMTGGSDPGIVFSQLNGMPSASGAIIVTLDTRSSTIVVNDEGMVEY